MIIGNRAVVPPGCPAFTGKGADIYTAPVNVYIHEFGPETDTHTEVFFGFGCSGDGGAILTDSLAVPFDSELSEQANNLRDRHAASPDYVEEKIRAAFVERVAHCPGLRDGVCGALGVSAVAEAVRQLGGS